jgi:hypothetical protein
MKRILLLLPLLLLFAMPLLAQYGGKAEANRVKFPKGSSSATLIGTLSSDEEMEFVFTVRRGQHAVVRNTSRVPFEVRVFSDELGVNNDWNNSASFTVDLPHPGDYLLFVRKRPGGASTGKFSVTLSLR